MFLQPATHFQIATKNTIFTLPSVLNSNCETFPEVNWRQTGWIALFLVFPLTSHIFVTALVWSGLQVFVSVSACFARLQAPECSRLLEMRGAWKSNAGAYYLFNPVRLNFLRYKEKMIKISTAQSWYTIHKMHHHT